MFLNNFIFSGPVKSLHLSFFVSLQMNQLNGIFNVSFRKDSQPAICLNFVRSNPLLNVCFFSISSMRRNSKISRLIRLSEILRNRCSESIMTWSRGIEGKRGGFLTYSADQLLLFPLTLGQFLEQCVHPL